MNAHGGPITVRGAGADREFDIRTRVTIGRAPENRLVVTHPDVSRLHAELYWRDGWFVADAGSSNGVYVGSRRISAPERVDGSVTVTLGRPSTGVRLVFDAGANVGLTQNASLADLPPVRRATPDAPVSRADRLPVQGLMIGRDPACHVTVADPLVSRSHARLVENRGELGIEDLGSDNGTFVNGVRVQRAALRERDVVTVGNSDFTVVGGALQPRPRSGAAGGVRLQAIDYTIGGKKLLSNITAEFRPGTLTAVIGPSGAGKSTLAKVMSGVARPSAGRVDFEGHDLHASYAALYRRIGMVPQDDVLHRLLTIRQALRYAARLRLPADTPKSDRNTAIERALGELSLTEHAGKRIDKLSGGQRKRASVALELLTSPTLLILDEPTSGLDPNLDRQVMVMLRGLADSGRTVVVITHAVANLDMCDQVVLLAPGGLMAYRGHPRAVAATFGTDEWADIFAIVTARPEESNRAFQAPPISHPPAVPPGRDQAARDPVSGTLLQFTTLVSRQARLIFADRGYLLFLLVVPFVLGGMALIVPGKSGFGPAAPGDFNEAYQLLIMLTLGACFMGATLSARDLVGERPIYLRERTAGLSSTAYLAAKLVVFWIAAIAQAAALVLTVTAIKPKPGPGVVIGSGTIELFVDIALTSCSCVMVGLLISAIAKTSEQIMPLLVVMIMGQLVMCGGLITVSGRAGLEQASWLFPARWGFASSSSTVDLQAITFLDKDVLWTHSVGYWTLDVAALLAITLVVTVGVRIRISKTVAA